MRYFLLSNLLFSDNCTVPIGVYGFKHIASFFDAGIAEFFGSGDNLPFLISPAPIQFGGDITCFDVPIAYMELVLFVLFYFVPVVSA